MAEEQRPTPSFFIDKLLQKDPAKTRENKGEELLMTSTRAASNSGSEGLHLHEQESHEGNPDVEICPSVAGTVDYRGVHSAICTPHHTMTAISHHGIAYQTTGICYGGTQEDIISGAGGISGGNCQVEVASGEGDGGGGKLGCFGLVDGEREERDIVEGSGHCPGQASLNGQSLHGHLHGNGQEHPAIPIQEESKVDVDMSVGDDGKKRPRTAFSAEQVRSLEQEFQRSKYLSVSKRTEMSRQLGLTEQQIKIWFQNRRTKWKRKYTNNLEILAQQHYLRMGLLPGYPIHTPAATTKAPNQYGALFGPNLSVRPTFPSPHQSAVRLYPPFNGPGLPRM